MRRNEETDKVAFYPNRREPIEQALWSIQKEINTGRLGAHSLWELRIFVSRGFSNIDKYKEFKDDWNKTLEQHGKVKLPHYRSLREEQELFFDLFDLMNEYMAKGGFDGFKLSRDPKFKDFPFNEDDPEEELENIERGLEEEDED